MSDPFIGEIRMFAGTFAPRGWAFCQGQLLAISNNSALFSILGTTYGGNGQTTFGLPNLQSRTPVGTGTGAGLSNVVLGQIGGVENVTLTTNQMPAHNHTVALSGTGTANIAQGASSANGNTPTPGPTTVVSKVPNGLANLNAFSTAAPDTTLLPASGTVSVTVSGDTSIAGANSAVPVVQPYLGMNFIIALEGIYPSRN